MLITLRNSGAESIHYTPNLDQQLLLKVVIKAENNSSVYDIFLKGENLDSFILDKETLGIKNIHLTVQDNGWSGDKKVTYQIKIITSNGDYRLHYKTNSGKPDFFKRIFKYLYPDMAEKQVEELV